MTIKKGDRGLKVRAIQELLRVLTDGIFGDKTEAAVRKFQADNGLIVDGIVGDKTWSMLLKRNFSLRKSKRAINEIIVHCTATPEGREVSVAEITGWHKDRGFADIGYHYVVHLDGSVENGRDVDVAGAHCTNHNTLSIGIVYVGGVEATLKNGQIVAKLDKNGNPIPKDTRTAAQKAALLKLLRSLRLFYPNARIYGHRDFANKACPCFNARAEYMKI